MNPAESQGVRIDPHAGEPAAERGASIEQIVDVIETGATVAAREGRFASEKLYSHHGFSKGKIQRLGVRFFVVCRGHHASPPPAFDDPSCACYN
jgi:hypothetical protein